MHAPPACKGTGGDWLARLASDSLSYAAAAILRALSATPPMDFAVQPAATVSMADVERLVSRDFAEHERDQARAFLEEYGKEDFHREIPRVRAAALKLAAGKLQELRGAVSLACYDYRDALSAAEYPASPRRNATPEDRIALNERNWRQYEEWFNRPSGR